MLTGDRILGRGTTIIDSSLGDYLHSLAALRALGAATVLPAPGPVLPDLAAICEAYLARRHQRLDQVRAALAELGPGATVGRVTDLIYAETDAAVRFAAEASVRAQLAYLHALTRQAPPRRRTGRGPGQLAVSTVRDRLPSQKAR